MKALSLTQPWCSLVALGEKQYETRSWPTNYRGLLAIHASKGFPPDCRALCWQTPFAMSLLRNGISNPDHLPLGAILCVVRMTGCYRTEGAADPVPRRPQHLGRAGGCGERG